MGTLKICSGERQADFTCTHGHEAKSRKSRNRGFTWRKKHSELKSWGLSIYREQFESGFLHDLTHAGTEN